MGISLYNYFRSSASYRVRIALNLKGLSFDYIPIHLTKNGGEQFNETYKRLNPYQLVPLLVDGNRQINQSLAIMEYLDETYPDPALLPSNPVDKAYVRALSMDIACEIHPLNNLRVLKYLTGQFGISEEDKNKWIHHWIELGFAALEKELTESTKRGSYCYGDTPTLADCCLIPQIHNARRFKLDMTYYPTLCAIEESCLKLDSFNSADPNHQPDSE